MLVVYCSCLEINFLKFGNDLKGIFYNIYIYIYKYIFVYEMMEEKMFIFVVIFEWFKKLYFWYYDDNCIIL